MTLSVPSLHSLRLNDPERLLEQLQAGGRKGELKKLVNGRYPHCTALRNYRFQSVETRKVTFECCKLMVAAKAPIDSRRHSLVSFFITYDWNDETPELNRELAQLYLNNGYVDANKTEPGHLHLQNTPSFKSTGGMSPVAAAITYDHLEALELLLAAGGTEDIGPVVKGGPPRKATEYAQEMMSTRCLTLLHARAMRSAISAQAAPLNQAPSPRRRAGL